MPDHHTLVLMTDGRKVAAERTDGVGDGLAALRSMLGLVDAPGCHRITLSGPRVNGSLTVDGPSKAEHSRPDMGPRPSGRDRHAARR